MTPLEQNFLIWACVTLLAVIAFIGAIFVHAFLKMAKDVSEIKTAVMVQASKHDDLERRVYQLETWR